IEELSKHAAVEEQVFYPVTRATVPKVEDVVLESLEEHPIVKWVLSELDGMSPEDERFDAKVTVLIENVRHHVKEEENEYFPKVRDELGRSALADLGEAMESAKKMAPTHPTPRAPDTPPGNLVMGAAAGVASRVGDTVSGLAQGGVTAVNDLVALILQRKRPQVSPRGNKIARSTATKVRSGASDATEAVIEATEEAKRKAQATLRAGKRGTARTAKAAKTGVKSTATSAKKSAKQTKTTAKRAATTTGRTARTAAKRTASAASR
ncbi:MAG TPA: hemerythrin domain-containing protein, partial [Acidimicrobiales bacterium]|nr:hemerythrin domain-containing protein [Acidimicrobiales bacterium]